MHCYLNFSCKESQKISPISLKKIAKISKNFACGANPLRKLSPAAQWGHYYLGGITIWIFGANEKGALLYGVHYYSGCITIGGEGMPPHTPRNRYKVV